MSLPTFENATRIEIQEAYKETTIDQFISEYVGADCHAVTYDDEIIYSYYDDDEDKQPILSLIQRDMVRDAIIKNPHTSLLVNVYRRRKDATITLYMFKPAYCVVLKYHAKTRKWDVYMKIQTNDCFNLNE